jgi:hypothetical protein
MQHYLAIKNEILSLITKWMNLKDKMLSEINLSQKDKYHLMSLMCGKYKVSVIEVESRIMVTKG